MSRQRREAILDEFEKSGMAGVPFTQLIGVKYQTFATWVSNRRKARGQTGPLSDAGNSHPLRLVEAVVEESSGKALLIIELPGGARVKVNGPEQMELVCRLLARLDKKERVC
jgi:hypothetical protein